MSEITLELPELHKKQKLVHDSKARFKILSCGRQWGKTSLAYILALESAVAGGIVWWVAPTSSIAGIGWRLLQGNLKDVPGVEIHITEKRIYLPGGGEIWIKSADNPDGLRGSTLDLIIVDEAAYIKDDVWEMVLSPMIAVRKGKAVFISTPNGVGNYFHRLWLLGQDENEEEYESWRFPSNSNPYMPESEFLSAKKRLPKLVFEQEWLGLFVADGQSVFKNIDEICCLQEQAPIPGEIYYAGIDWGSKNDPTVMVVVNVLKAEMVYMMRIFEEEFEKQYAEIERVASRYNISRMIVEENNIGIAPFQALRTRGLPVIPFVTNNTSKFEIVSKLIHGMDTYKVKFLDDEILKSELKTYEATRTATGLWKYAAKGKNHDDTVMATLLAFSLLSLEQIYVPSKLVVSVSRKEIIKELEKNKKGGAFPLTYGYTKYI